ncbi:hypothetical protein JD844_027559 [Phrynosoma platyrhinos]|uniref:SAM domain-containing protein n=1 Tax=Phrynosoma platyrhinos TaxID=52577 RepID=A0ABQ7SGH3_PHRPL|nr:hypothetical protein JD844_027559 [Phrynosoma platyrhinos]
MAEPSKAVAERYSQQLPYRNKKMMSDASEMLAAALEQMDGIIAGSKALEYSNGIFDCQSPTSPFMGSLRALHLVEDLRGLLEMMEVDEKEGLRCQVPDSTAEILIEWLQSQMTNGHISANGDVYQERLARLENDKESLVLQVSVLTDQVDAQGEKIRDLELCLEEHREKLNATEEMLQQGLMREVNELRLKVGEMDSERLQYEKKLNSTKSLMAKLSSMKIKVGQMQYEKQRMEQKCQMLKEELASLKDKLEQKEGEIKCLQEKLVHQGKGEGVDINDRDIEVQKMKKAVESLMAANEEKDRKIEELRQALNRYKKVQDMVILAQVKKGKDDEYEESANSGSVSVALSDVQNLSELEKSPSPTPVTGSPNHEEFRAKTPEENPLQIHTSVLQVSIPSFSPSCRRSDESTDKVDAQSKMEITGQVSEKNTTMASIEAQLGDTKLTSALQKSSSLGNLKNEASDGKEAGQKQEESKTSTDSNKYGTLPPKSPGEEDAFGTRKARSSFGRGFFKIKSNKRTASAPNLVLSFHMSYFVVLGMFPPFALRVVMCVIWMPEDRSRSASAPILAETEKVSADHLDLAGLPPRPKDDMTESEFKRGGTRATAGPRLGWSRDLGQSNNDLDMPFAKWTKEQVCNWLQDQGLGSYIGNGKHWILSGQTLLQASQPDLEKELGIKHPLHRKKLQLALQALGSEEENNHGKLDYNWVTRWLDDIGLPQYKTQFDEGKVDGRMLHYMTIDDLLSLKVVSVLHHLSIKHAIQVLRINNFEPNCLRRRPSDEVLEPRFNVETLAQLLNIPPNKTLLRRHLATHFNLLIGQEAQQQKREAMESPEYVLLTATAKVKPKKLAFSNFGNLRKKKQDDGEEYVCPMELGQTSGIGSKKGFKPGLDIRVYDDDDLDRLEQVICTGAPPMEDSEGTVRQIGAFSEGINNLTHMLKEDEMFKDFATRSPSTSITDEDSNV